MRLLLDEMLSPAIARKLRNRDHDVIAINERQEWRGYRDDQVIELARSERRAVVTANVRDYRPRTATAALPGGPGHFGVIFIPGHYRLAKTSTGRILTALEQLLADHPGDQSLRNMETWLS